MKNEKYKKLYSRLERPRSLARSSLLKHENPLGEAFYQLWDYEVVELFFLNSESKRYLEVEFGPHGQHLVLLLNGGPDQCLEHSLPLEYTCEIGNLT